MRQRITRRAVRWASTVFLVALAHLGGSPNGVDDARAASSLKVSGSGKKQVLVRSQFSSAMQSKYDVFAKKCTRCHAMKRPISALNTGITPVSGAPFENKYIKKYVVKMMRKPKSGIAKSDAKEILKFLLYARKKARGGS